MGEMQKLVDDEFEKVFEQWRAVNRLPVNDSVMKLKIDFRWFFNQGAINEPIRKVLFEGDYSPLAKV